MLTSSTQLQNSLFQSDDIQKLKAHVQSVQNYNIKYANFQSSSRRRCSFQMSVKTNYAVATLNREVKKLRRLPQRKRQIKIELCARLCFAIIPCWSRCTK